MSSKEIIRYTFSSLFLFGWTAFVSSCGDTELDAAIKDALADGKLSQEEIIKLNEAFSKDDEQKDKTRQDWVKYIVDVCFDEDLTFKKEEKEKFLRWEEEPEKPVVVNFYLDNTQSMSGYIKSLKNDVFTSAFSIASGVYSNQVVTINAFYTQSINSKTQIVSVSFDELESDLTSHKLNSFTDSYQLDDFFSEITSKVLSTDSDEICFFYTDGIPSGTNEEIRNNPEFSRVQSATLKKRIADAIRPLSENDCAAAVYRFLGNYNGPYWKYNNNHSTILTNQNRPFFVIAIGKTKLVNAFDEKVNNGLKDFKPENSVLFSKNNTKFTPTKKNPIEKIEANRLYMKDPDDMGSKEYNISFDRTGLPSYMNDEKSIRKNILFKYEGEQLEYEIKDSRLTVEITPEANVIRTLHIEIKDNLPTWVSQYSSTDDKDMSNNNQDNSLNKTFNLEILMEGIKEGIMNKVGEEYYLKDDYVLDTNPINE